jgi:hypothetical protein
MFRLASHPPLDQDFLVSRLWDQFWPGWREDAKKRDLKKSDVPKRDERLKKFLDEIDKAETVTPPPITEVADPPFMQIVRHIPKRRGRWSQFGPKIDNPASAEEGDSVAITQMISETEKTKE